MEGALMLARGVVLTIALGGLAALLSTLGACRSARPRPLPPELRSVPTLADLTNTDDLRVVHFTPSNHEVIPYFDPADEVIRFRLIETVAERTRTQPRAYLWTYVTVGLDGKVRKSEKVPYTRGDETVWPIGEPMEIASVPTAMSKETSPPSTGMVVEYFHEQSHVRPRWLSFGDGPKHAYWIGHGYLRAYMGGRSLMFRTRMRGIQLESDLTAEQHAVMYWHPQAQCWFLQDGPGPFTFAMITRADEKDHRRRTE
jgi:hypothetical protein